MPLTTHSVIPGVNAPTQHYNEVPCGCTVVNLYSGTLTSFFLSCTVCTSEIFWYECLGVYLVWEGGGVGTGPIIHNTYYINIMFT